MGNARWLALAIICTFGMLIGCGGKMATLTPMDDTDTPEYNYSIGMKHLDAGEHESALKAFERAAGLDPKFAPAHEGIGLVHLAQNNLEAAREALKQCKKLDDEYAPGYIAMGRVYLAEDELRDARKEFHKARRLAPKDADADYYLGVSFMQERLFDEAERWFHGALEKNPAHAAADQMWEKVDKIRRAAPGTELGTTICLKETLSRAEFCTLLIEELELDRKLKDVETEAAGSRRNVPDLTDIGGHWAERNIRAVVKLGVMQQFPDHTFLPDEPMQRAHLALAVQSILVQATGEEELTTRFVGSASPFPDVNSGMYGYNAILLTSTRGILAADVATGNFDPEGSISGADGLLALRKLMALGG